LEQQYEEEKKSWEEEQENLHKKYEFAQDEKEMLSQSNKRIMEDHKDTIEQLRESKRRDSITLDGDISDISVQTFEDDLRLKDMESRERNLAMEMENFEMDRRKFEMRRQEAAWESETTEKLKKEIREKKDELLRFHGEVNAKDMELNFMRQTLRDIQSKYNNAEDKLFDSQHELEQATRTEGDVKSLEESIQLKDEEIEELRHLLDEREQELSGLRIEQAKVNSNYNKMKEQFIRSKQNVKKFRDSVRQRIQLFRGEEKEVIQTVKSLMASMENASTAKLAITNPQLSKSERITLSNSNMKNLVQSVKSIIRSQKQAEIDDPDIAGSSKILVHPDLKELCIALLVKFGSAMIYANNQANASKRNSTDDHLVVEYKKRIEELSGRVNELEENNSLAEDVKKLLYQQVEETTNESADKTRVI